MKEYSLRCPQRLVGALATNAREAMQLQFPHQKRPALGNIIIM